MKSLVCFASVHHGNTRKVAQSIGIALSADLMQPNRVTPELLARYDLVGFGSGIYFRRHHESLFHLLERLPDQKGKPAFIFSTEGLTFLHSSFHKTLRQKLTEKGFRIVGEFACPGWDTYAIFGWFGGVHRGRPDERDLDAAREFAEGLKNKKIV